MIHDDPVSEQRLKNLVGKRVQVSGDLFQHDGKEFRDRIPTNALYTMNPFIKEFVRAAVRVQQRDVELDPARKADRHGERLPPGAVARLHNITNLGGAVCHGMSFSPDGSLLAFIAPDGDTHIWDIKAEKELHRFPHDPRRAPSYASCRVFSNDGKLLIGDDGVVWDVATGKLVERFGPVPKLGDPALVYPTPSPDGKTVLFLTNAHGDGEVVMFDIATRKELRRFGKGTRGDGPLIFSPDGKMLAIAKHPPPVIVPVGGGQNEKRPEPAEITSGIMIWNPVTGEKMAEWSATVWAPLGFSDDGKTLYVLSGEKLVAWDVTTSKPVREPFGHSMRSAVLLPDRKTLAVVDWKGLALWSIPEEKQIGHVERRVPMFMQLASSPTGRWLAFSETDGTILVWDVAALRAKQ